MADNNISTPMDDLQFNSGAEDAMLADILRSSPIAQEAGVAPPPLEENEESHSEVAPQSSDELEDDDDLRNPDESAEEGEVELDDEEESEGEDADEDATATQEDAYALDDLEDIAVTHIIDGEEVTRPLSEWITGSATKQHLSQEGRKIGEARKQLEEERTVKLAEIEKLGNQLAYAAQHEESQLSQEYHDLTKELQKATKDDDTYEIGELTKKQLKVQQKYWEARNKREGVTNAVAQQVQNQQNANYNKQVEHFHQEIPNMISDWDEKVQQDVRAFALEEGLPEALIDYVADPAIVKFVDDYRRLKQGVSKGAKKRAAATTKNTKKVPAKKGASKKQKQTSKENLVVARAMREDASSADQMAFLRQHASKTLGSV